uniref:Ovule protein n=1 Tax=Steinernema glaseri TaxID=37863 RepID=A0A1I7ZFP8_9BILA
MNLSLFKDMMAFMKEGDRKNEDEHQKRQILSKTLEAFLLCTAFISLPTEPTQPTQLIQPAHLLESGGTSSASLQCLEASLIYITSHRAHTTNSTDSTCTSTRIGRNFVSFVRFLSNGIRGLVVGVEKNYRTSSWVF